MSQHTHRITTLLLLLSVSFLWSFAQDMLVRQARADHRLSPPDSVTVRKVVKEKAKANTITESSLYTTWNTSGVNVYGNQPLPDTYEIDLRGFVMPTPSRNVTSRYGYRAQFRRNHYGLDIKVYTGDTLVSAWDGRVRVVSYDARGWGKYVVVRHPNGLETLYAHMSKHLVTTGQYVKAGEPIGLGGNTGRSTGSHLHLECRLLGETINPELLFDFPNQDMTGETYIWHNTNPRRRMGSVPETTVAETTTPDVAPPVVQPKPAAPPASRTRYYKVKKGDSPYSIARRVGLSVDQLLRKNGLNNRSMLRPGQILKY